jgi:DNA-binding FrmR family transcriptional regulator
MMNEGAKRQMRSRLRRLAGQAAGLEAALEHGDVDRIITQLEAVAGASRAALRFYVEHELFQKESLTSGERRQLLRLIQKA